MKNKLTPEGYKIISLCDYGYTWVFVFTSQVEKDNLIEFVSSLNNIGSANSNISSKDFRINLAWDLIRDTLDNEKKKELQDLQAPFKVKLNHYK
ncbi:3630_t:CDS:2 [Dentiscutata erythropus]|uniref:3630_t:CDS:1 n=1 Tax=Dentiscutata erythropus TaxID=1348616 RepID=A0A9N9AZJ6_9GLOM|nr:3630_t:CDS:2 [Dentiscutata erythropus]